MTLEFQKWLAFGAGIGIRIDGDDLVVTIVRVRPSGARVLATATIRDFRNRPAGQWGADYAKILSEAGASHLAATVLLPRGEVIVRTLTLPGVSGRDLESAVNLQVDSLHPYPEGEAAYAWARIPGTSQVLVGICRTQVVDRYALLFAEAGIRVASMTFSAAVIRSAIRFWGALPADGFLVLVESADGLEAYGESPARPVFSAAFEIDPEQAAQVAAAELRASDDIEPRSLEELLPAPKAPGEPSRPDPVSYATALTVACPWLALDANLLPAEQRTYSSRAVYIPTIALAALLLILAGGLGIYSKVLDDRYLGRLQSEIERLTAIAGEVRETEGQEELIRYRMLVLDEFRSRTAADLDAMRELTAILEPPIWLRSMRLARDSVVVVGEAPQAAPLIETIDNSPRFRNSEFVNPMSRIEGGETFSIRTARETPPAGGAQ